jgi:hypothetical protein
VVPLAIFLVTRVVDGALLAWVGRDQLPALVVPGQVVPTSVDPATYLHLIANWDGQWYRQIAEHGYPRRLPTEGGTVTKNVWAFFPLYPAVVRAVMATGLSFALAASLVSITCGAAAMCLLYRMLHPAVGGFSASLSVLALCTYPAAVTLQVAYSESLALLLILVALWCLRERRYGALLVTGLVLSLTRPIVLPLALVVAVHGIARWRRRDTAPFSRGEAVRVGLVAAALAASFLLWPAITGLATGRADAYFVTANAWYGRNVHGWASWLVVLVGGGNVGLAVVIGIAVVVLGLLIARPVTRLWGLELRTWAWAYPLYILGSTRPTSSIIRYAMLAIVPWWPFPDVGEHVRGTGQRWGLAVFVGVVGLLSQYLWLRWFFTLGPGNLGFP